VAVLGCCHGELQTVYDRIQHHEQQTGHNIDLLVCCGDFQSLRTWTDFHTLAVPSKYRTALGSFLPYYIGAKVAPVTTIVIGGNHEASQSLQELYYGGWLAPKIFYLGAAGVVRYRGLRIAGLSGIYKGYSYRKPHWERPPYDPSTSLRSIYHVRQVDVTRLQSLQSPAQEGKRIDILLSHDWPRGMEQYGNVQELLRKKPFFRQDIENNELGNPYGMDILQHLQPHYWFAAHLHVQFEATVPHHDSRPLQHPSNTDTSSTTTTTPPQSQQSSPPAAQLKPSQVISAKNTESHKDNDTEETEQTKTTTKENTTRTTTSTTHFMAVESKDPCGPPDLTQQMTQFLALDKCLPRKPYLSIIHIPRTTPEEENEEDDKSPKDITTHHEAKLEYDMEWLTVLRKTHHWTSIEGGRPIQPITVSTADIQETQERILQQQPSLYIPENFTPTLPCLPSSAATERIPHPLPSPLPQMGNPQTDKFLELLGLSHCPSGLTVPYNPTSINTSSSSMDVAAEDPGDENEIDLEDV
jgi:lariat debranching enzyme